MEMIHFKSRAEAEQKQFAHAVTKDRVLLSSSNDKLTTKNVEEIQSDYITNVYDFGLKTDKNIKLSTEIMEEADKVFDTLSKKVGILTEGLEDLIKNKNTPEAINIIENKIVRN